MIQSEILTISEIREHLAVRHVHYRDMQVGEGKLDTFPAPEEMNLMTHQPGDDYEIFTYHCTDCGIDIDI